MLSKVSDLSTSGNGSLAGTPSIGIGELIFETSAPPGVTPMEAAVEIFIPLVSSRRIGASDPLRFGCCMSLA